MTVFDNCAFFKEKRVIINNNREMYIYEAGSGIGENPFKNICCNYFAVVHYNFGLT